MALTNAFYEAVRLGNVRLVRIMMKDSLLVDPTFAQFAEMERVTCDMSGLYDEHDGREFNIDKTSWDDNYMNKLKVQVVNNFSHERLKHLKEVVRYLRPIKQTVSTNICHDNESAASYKEQKQYDKKEGDYREVKVVSGAVAGAVIGGTIAAATSITIIGGAVVGAVVGGAAVAVSTSGGK